MSEDEDPEQPVFVLAGYRRQLPADMEDRRPLDPHAYWRSLPAQQASDAHRFVFILKKMVYTIIYLN